MKPLKISTFQTDISAIELPERFTFPFAYKPHLLSVIAMNELQNYLEKQGDFSHPFGLLPDETSTAIGKMFGVLVVKDEEGNIGYLSAFSGKLANSNHVSFFVPPVFDMLEKESFFVEEEFVLNAINEEIEQLENSDKLQSLINELQQVKIESEEKIRDKKILLKQLKKERSILREELEKSNMSIEEKEIVLDDLIKQSLRDKHELNVLKDYWKVRIDELEEKKNHFLSQINQLKEERKKRSNELQKRLFESYSFLNAEGERANLLQIFHSNTHQVPPAGAGECCAPKLLQYAYLNRLKPICMAEFWWGSSPKSEVRLHKQFYPSCWGKCAPILGHMLKGLEVDENPLLDNPAQDLQLNIVYEDAYLLVVDKPANFLSVPGIHIIDSVYSRVKLLYPNATGPVIIHRLDMATSGLLVLAKSKEIHKKIQSQFIKRIVKKRYTALLDGEVKESSGKIILPLRVDLDDRPRQMVCYDYGKYAETHYEVQWVKNGKTLIHFYPITGRTHQLRVHSAHQSGLGVSIQGDDLYGRAAERMCLHAGMLSFIHPVTNKWITFESKADFE